MVCPTLWLVLCTWPAFADNYPRQPAIDALHYTFRISLSDDNDEVAGEATADFRFLQSGVAQVALDLTSVRDGKGMTVAEVSSGGAGLRFQHSGDRLVITLDSTPAAGERRQFTVKYHGIPGDGLHIAKNKFGDRTFFSWNWPTLARQWLPIVDHPYDKATSEFLVTAPARYQVVANGLLQEVLDLGDGRRMTHWKQSVPIASWLNNIGVAQFAWRRFDTAAGVPLETWIFPQDRDKGILTFEEPTRRSIEFYASHIGPYPYERLADVEVAGMGGAMEHATAIFFGERSVTGRPAFELVAHETAHQWFGDAVTEDDWHHVWLSEGFATYGSALWAEHVGGVKARDEEMRDDATRVFESPATERPVIDLQATDLMGLLNTNSYPKGAWVLHSLRGLMGDRAFFVRMREYYRHYRDSTVLSSDFARVMSKAAGQDLGWYFTQSLTQPGYPVLDLSWTYDGNRLTIDILQVQKESWGTYRLPGLVLLIDGWPAKVNVAGASTHVVLDHIAEVPRSIVVDPDGWWLLKATVRRGK